MLSLSVPFENLKSQNETEEKEVFIEKLKTIKQKNLEKMRFILESGGDRQEEYERSLLNKINTNITNNYEDLVEIYNI